MNKKIETVATETMNALVDYSWPGNIRELQNVIERAVLISNGPTLKVPLSDLAIRPSRPASQHKPVKVGEEAQPMRTVLEEVERKQNWQLWSSHAELSLDRMVRRPSWD